MIGKTRSPVQTSRGALWCPTRNRREVETLILQFDREEKLHLDREPNYVPAMLRLTRRVGASFLKQLIHLLDVNQTSKQTC